MTEVIEGENSAFWNVIVVSPELMVLLPNKTMKFIVIKPPIIRNKPISNKNLARILSSTVFLLAILKIEYDKTIKPQKILSKKIHSNAA